MENCSWDKCAEGQIPGSRRAQTTPGDGKVLPEGHASAELSGMSRYKPGERRKSFQVRKLLCKVIGKGALPRELKEALDWMVDFVAAVEGSYAGWDGVIRLLF